MSTKSRFRPLVHRQGQSLIEILVALAIAVLVLLALVSLATSAVKNAQFSRNQDQSEKIAQAGMEWVRSMRDRLAWNDFSTTLPAGAVCLYGLPNSTNPLTDWGNLRLDDAACQLIDNFFHRTLLLQQNDVACGTNGFKATVVVVWNDSSGSHKSEQSSCFTNWQNK